MSTTREYSLCLLKKLHYSFDQVYKQQVTLEQIFIRDLTVYGNIRVNNISFNKKVFIHFTNDQWENSFTIQAYYSTHYPDSNTDLFQFKLIITEITKNILFAICYCTDHGQFWDNNSSENYNLFLIEK